MLTAELLFPLAGRAVSLVNGLSEAAGGGIGALVILIFGFVASTWVVEVEDSESGAGIVLLAAPSVFGAALLGPPSFSSRLRRICVMKHG